LIERRDFWPDVCSIRLSAIVSALPIKPGMRVLEIGCGSGAMAREIARQVGAGHVLAIDRSAKAIAQARNASQTEIASGQLSLRPVAIEQFEREPGEAPYDIAVAIRVGALDGRHPELENEAHRRIAAALTSRGRLFVDKDDSLREIRFIARRHADVFAARFLTTAGGGLLAGSREVAIIRGAGDLLSLRHYLWVSLSEARASVRRRRG
jgi:SAM-dependent methyltransferase